MADALKRAQATHEEIQKATCTKGFIGITGSITLDANRNAQKSAVVLETTATGNTFKQKLVLNQRLSVSESLQFFFNDLAQYLLNGLAQGSIYALIA